MYWLLSFKQVYQESPFTAVSAQRRNGLILCKANHAEFAGPGAAVGRSGDLDCHSAIALGKKWELVELGTAEETQNAYRRRIQWMYWLKKITEQKLPHGRAEALLSSFDAFFDPEAIASLPPATLAQLVGVFDGTMVQVHRHHYEALGISVPAQALPNQYWHYVELPQTHWPAPVGLELPQPNLQPNLQPATLQTAPASLSQNQAPTNPALPNQAPKNQGPQNMAQTMAQRDSLHHVFT